jgi:hypothetical protein
MTSASPCVVRQAERMERRRELNQATRLRARNMMVTVSEQLTSSRNIPLLYSAPFVRI